MSKDISPELEKFLKEKCKPKQFIHLSTMVTLDTYEDFVKHLNKFKEEVALVNRDNGEAVLLGGKDKFKIVEDKDE